jgi:hypothetical protein
MVVRCVHPTSRYYARRIRGQGEFDQVFFHMLNKAASNPLFGACISYVTMLPWEHAPVTFEKMTPNPSSVYMVMKENLTSR